MAVFLMLCFIVMVVGDKAINNIDHAFARDENSILISDDGLYYSGESLYDTAADGSYYPGMSITKQLVLEKGSNVETMELKNFNMKIDMIKNGKKSIMTSNGYIDSRYTKFLKNMTIDIKYKNSPSSNGTYIYSGDFYDFIYGHDKEGLITGLSEGKSYLEYTIAMNESADEDICGLECDFDLGFEAVSVEKTTDVVYEKEDKKDAEDRESRVSQKNMFEDFLQATSIDNDLIIIEDEKVPLGAAKPSNYKKVSKPIINGGVGGRLNLNRDITIAELATVIGKSMDLNSHMLSAKQDLRYSGKWYKNYILLGEQFGYLSKIDESFNPDSKVTQEELEKIISACMVVGQGENQVSEADIKRALQKYFYDYYSDSYGEKIVSSEKIELLLIDPTNPQETVFIKVKDGSNFISRGEAFEIIYDLLISDKGSIVEN